MNKYFTVINKTKKTTIATKVKIADNPISRTVGLLNRCSIEDREGMLIVPCKSIHSMFMRFKFDAVFIDKNNNVVYLIKQMSAWKVSSYVCKAHKVLELAAGIIDATKTEIGDTIEII